MLHTRNFYYVLGKDGYEKGRSIGLGRYLAIRTAQVIPVILVVITINFIIIHAAPGDIADYVTGDIDPTPEEQALIRKKYGLDKPLLTQYVIYISNILKLDLGDSWRWNQPVIRVISLRLPATYLLILTSFIISLILGILIATYVSRKIGGKLSRRK